MREGTKQPSGRDENQRFPDEPKAEGLSTEPHFSIQQISEMWGLSKDAVRRIFRDVPGVLIIGKDNHERGKRRYTTLRIPQSVLERIHGQYSFGNSVLIRYSTEPK